MSHDWVETQTNKGLLWMEQDLRPSAKFKQMADDHRQMIQLFRAEKISLQQLESNPLHHMIMCREWIIEWTGRAKTFLDRYESGDYDDNQALEIADYLDAEVPDRVEGEYPDYPEKGDEPFDPNDAVLNEYNETHGQVQSVVRDIEYVREKSDLQRLGQWPPKSPGNF